METTTACLNDHHHFSDYDDDDEDDHYNNHRNRRRIFSLLPPPSFAFPESIEEEELEWISNKDAFAMAESFVDILPNHPSISSATTTTTTATTTTTTTTTTSHDNNGSSHLSLSPVSVLENSSTTSCSNNNGSGIGSGSGSGSGSGGYVNINNLRCFFKVPGKARTKRPNRRREMSGERFQCWEKVRVGHGPGPGSGLGLGVGPRKSGIGRKCLHCGSEKTPQWRAGPNGPKTLCNACGVRYKSGRLVPEYRPASSPTFSSELHSNSHRKIVEMRKQKMGDGEGDGDGHGGAF